MADIYLSILIIEDQDFKSNAIRDFILSLDEKIDIDIAKDQVSALIKLETTKYDILLLDMCLPLRIGENANEKGGELILDELEISEVTIRPSTIVALTQYDYLQEELRNKYPELGAIKYSNINNNWQRGIQRIIISSKKNKVPIRKLVYCEEKNDQLYNSIGLRNIEFRGLKGGSRKIYESAKFEKDSYSIRDKDYLTKNEVRWLTESKFDNYFILEYYCFENYLYHPSNLIEYFETKNVKFDQGSYIEEIIRQKNDKLLNIAQGIQISRNAYFDFTDNEKKNMDKSPEIIECLKSDDFEIFYPYFDMKGTNKSKAFDKKVLSDYNIDQRDLVKTGWFEKKISQVLKKII